MIYLSYPCESCSSKNSNKLKKLLASTDSQSTDDNSWEKVKKVIAKNTGSPQKVIHRSVSTDQDKEERNERLALLRDARKAAVRSPSKSDQGEPERVYHQDDDIGQRTVGGKKTAQRVQDALPLVPKGLKKSLTGHCGNQDHFFVH